MPEWLKLGYKAAARSVDSVSQTNLAPALAFSCAVAVVCMYAWHRINHPGTHTHLRDR